jgi:hypothetical protein
MTLLFKKKLVLGAAVAVVVGALAACDLTGTGSADLLNDLTSDDSENLSNTGLVPLTDRQVWEQVKTILSTPFKDGVTTNGASCIGCHSNAEPAAKESLAFANNTTLTGVPTQWYCENLRGKANMADVGSGQGDYYDAEDPVAQGVDPGNTLGTSVTAAHRNSRLLEKMGGAAYGLASGSSQMPRDRKTYGVDTVNPVKATAAQMAIMVEWVDRGAPCWEN